MTLSDDMLRDRLRGQEWTHNVRLSPNVSTRPDWPLMEEDDRLRGILRVLHLLYGEDLAGLRVADLGCLEGGYALALAQRGAVALGIEARSTNVEKARLLREHFALPNLDFVVGDVKEFTSEKFGRFDAVMALGILYHLDDPVRWLAQLGTMTDVLIVDTHYAPDDDAGVAKMDSNVATVGPLDTMTVDGFPYQGRWYREYGESDDKESATWAAYSNPRSFWLTHQSLVWALRHAGFDVVFEQHDRALEHYETYRSRLSRGQFVAARSKRSVRGPAVREATMSGSSPGA